MAEKPEQEPNEEGGAPAAKPAAGNNKLMPIILIVNTVLMGAVLAVVMLRKPPAPVAAAHSDHGEESGKDKGKEKEGEGGEHGEKAGEHGAKEGEHGEKSAKEGEKVEGAPGPILKLENFIIQLRGSDSDRYVRVAFDLELTAEGDRAPVLARMPHIRDSVIAYFSDRSLDELRGSEGMDRIKTAVSKRLDEILAANRVRAVFITELVIQ